MSVVVEYSTPSYLTAVLSSDNSRVSLSDIKNLSSELLALKKLNQSLSEAIQSTLLEFVSLSAHAPMLQEYSSLLEKTSTEAHSTKLSKFFGKPTLQQIKEAGGNTDELLGTIPVSCRRIYKMLMLLCHPDRLNSTPYEPSARSRLYEICQEANEAYSLYDLSLLIALYCEAVSLSTQEAKLIAEKTSAVLEQESSIHLLLSAEYKKELKLYTTMRESFQFSIYKTKLAGRDATAEKMFVSLINANIVNLKFHLSLDRSKARRAKFSAFLSRIFKPNRRTTNLNA